TSSEAKGETIQDTLQNLTAMGIQLFVLRHRQDGLPQAMAHMMGNACHIVNAGDGMHAHPSQALLDMMTILEKKPDVSQLKIAIIGDIKRSRVANSLQCLCAQLNVKSLHLVSPADWQPKQIHYGEITHSLSDGIADADVI